MIGSIWWRLNPLFIRAMKNAPSTVRQTAPSPPAIEVPPTMTAVKTANTNEKSSLGWAERVREASSAPARAEAAPVSTKVVITTFSTRMPARRAASGLPPTAKRWRPNRVRSSRNQKASTTAMAIQEALVRPQSRPWATRRKSRSWTRTMLRSLSRNPMP